ncbi:MAG: nuclear transport factor 2 family protein [Methanobacteriaceae archaeon]|jgi:predicted ester cyclase|nr:nuclear transport factor 2 family protein [Methanobacteriaceae archaeon]OPY22692.1 MAG: SnoaL-like domain protein [Methanobacterium sp. PtaU1.Bin097]
MVSKAKQMKIIIDQYVKAYNEFDVDKMVRNIHPDVEFKNIANGEVNMHIQGLETFKKQVKDSTNLLKKREMTITKQTIEGDVVKNKIDFKAVLNVDIPEGPKSGELVKLKGESVFKFKGGKIIYIEDIS